MLKREVGRQDNQWLATLPPELASRLRGPNRTDCDRRRCTRFNMNQRQQAWVGVDDAVKAFTCCPEVLCATKTWTSGCPEGRERKAANCQLKFRQRWSTRTLRLALRAATIRHQEQHSRIRFLACSSGKKRISLPRRNGAGTAKEPSASSESRSWSRQTFRPVTEEHGCACLPQFLHPLSNATRCCMNL